MSLAEAVKRAGSFEALLPYLLDGRILARAAGFQTWPPGSPEISQLYKTRPTPEIPPEMWGEAYDIDPVAGRACFAVDDIADLMAFGIEIEPAAVDKWFPTASASGPRDAGGRDPDNDWDGAAGHVGAWVDAHGPLPRRKNGQPNRARAVELMTEWFDKEDPPAPARESIYRWLRTNPRPEWWM